MPTYRNDGHRVATNLVKGALAGAVATWAMGKATTWMYEQESEAVRNRESAARDGKSAYLVAAHKASRMSGIHLSENHEETAGTAIHWALGIAAGAAYGVIRHRLPVTAALKGLSFGTGFFMVIDEVMNPALGLTPGPTAFPWQTHARGLGGHLVFGLVSEGMLEGLDRVAGVRI